jgi:hypothetical protein
MLVMNTKGGGQFAPPLCLMLLEDSKTIFEVLIKLFNV